MRYLSSNLVILWFLVVFSAFIISGCSLISDLFTSKTLEAPLKTNVRRGATRVDVYGAWAADFSLVGAPNARFSYKVRYVPTGTEVYTNGTTNGSQLQAWDGLPVFWRLTGDVGEWGAPDRRLDALGMAGNTLLAGGTNGGTLAIHVRLPPEIPGGLRPEMIGNTVFETDPSQPSVPR